MQAQKVKPDIERGLMQSSILAAREYYPEALALLEHSERAYNKKRKSDWIDRRGKLDYQQEIDILKNQIEQDITEQTTRQ